VLIEELTLPNCLDLLARVRSGRLACARDAQPYIVPFYFAYHNNCLYSFSTAGQKIEWMRANPLVCVEADEVVSAHQWMSVIVVGRYEELVETPEWRSERELAWKLLQQYPMWWEPGYAKTIVHGAERPLEPVFYRVNVTHVTGRRAAMEQLAPVHPALRAIGAGEGGALQRVLRLIQGGFRQ
jgi:nitroimidazol reductase NimA-like FMN-containing flavoprotein (pyridoxamine 5'-phosphate oxidase superfamily)